MSDYRISRISPKDSMMNRLVNELLEREHIRRDRHLDYTCGMFDADFNIVATGSCFGNTLRCMAVSSDHQGEGLMNEIVSHLMEVQCARGNVHLFLYTKCDSAKFFGSLGFYEIAQIENQLVFMENRKTGFSSYLAKLEKGKVEADSVATLVMNANPFTLGHLHLVEKAAQENDVLHLFIVSEDTSLVPFAVRKKLVMEGTAHLKNIIYHDSGPYIISNATFPSYFQKDEASVIRGHAELDLNIFKQIGTVLGVTRRYVGEEPNSIVTGIYNDTMARELPKAGMDCVIVPRKMADGLAISASTVRVALKNGDWDMLRKLVPESTVHFFMSAEAEVIIQRIRAEENVVHY